jgi:hypothetical protein
MNNPPKYTDDLRFAPKNKTEEEQIVDQKDLLYPQIMDSYRNHKNDVFTLLHFYVNSSLSGMQDGLMRKADTLLDEFDEDYKKDRSLFAPLIKKLLLLDRDPDKHVFGNTPKTHDQYYEYQDYVRFALEIQQLLDQRNSAYAKEKYDTYDLAQKTLALLENAGEIGDPDNIHPLMGVPE